MNPITDPAFYAFAVPAVFIMGMGKGGFGGNLAMLAMPLMAMSGPAMQAAAVMFPILLVMDAISVWSWRRTWSRENVLIMLPGGLAGTLLAYLTVAYVSDHAIRLILGLLSVAFCLQAWLFKAADAPPRPAGWMAGTLWSAAAGFTSLIAHVGGPQLSMYLLPQKLAKEVFAGTLIVYFAILNVVKIAPLTALGLFTPAVLSTSLLLTPVAIVATLFGVWIVRRMSTEAFFRFTYWLLFLVGLKLAWDGAVGLLA